MTGRHAFGDSSGADSFADALDGTASGLVDDTEMLLVIVDRLHGLSGTAVLEDAGPKAEFRTRLRGRLLEEAGELHDSPAGDRVVSITSRWTQSWGRRNRTRLVSGLAAGIVGLTAVSVAAANSLPGSPFYNLKRDSESLRYAVAGSDEDRGKLELGFARTRLSEIDRLTEHDAAWGVAPVSTPQAAGATDTTILATSLDTKVVRLFHDMDAEAAKGSALLARSFKNHPRPGPILAVQQFAAAQEKSLATLKTRLSGPALSSATQSLTWARVAVKTAAMVLQSCGTQTCSTASLAHLVGPLAPTPSDPTQPSSVTPAPSATGTPATTQPGQPGQPPVVVPTAPVPPGATVTSGTPTSPAPPTGGQPTAPPTGGQPSPTDTGGQPTSTVPPTTPAPTTTPPPTDQPTNPPTVPPTSGPPTADPSQTPTAPPTTVPPPSPPVDTTAPPVIPPPTAPPVDTTTPPAVTPPTTTPPPPSTAAPTTTPVVTTKPPIICLPPLKIIGGICIRPGRGPIHD